MKKLLILWPDPNFFIKGGVFLKKLFFQQVMLEKKFYEEQFPKDMKVFEDKFVPKDGFFMGDAVSCL